MKPKHLKISQVSLMLGLCEHHVRRFGEDYGLAPVLTPGGHRRYTVENVSEARDKLTAEMIKKLERLSRD